MACCDDKNDKIYLRLQLGAAEAPAGPFLWQCSQVSCSECQNPAGPGQPAPHTTHSTATWFWNHWHLTRKTPSYKHLRSQADTLVWHFVAHWYNSIAKMNLRKMLEKPGWDFTIIILRILSGEDGYFQESKIPIAINETVSQYKLWSSLWKDNKRNKNYWAINFLQYKCTEDWNKLRFKNKKCRTL